MVYMFPQNMCPSGNNEINVTMNLPDNIPHSLEYGKEDTTISGIGKIRISYVFRAQVVPFYSSDVQDEDGHCSLASSIGITVSPVRPIVSAPTFNNELFISKDCFLMNSKICNAVITVPKSFYHIGETAYFNVNIDNS